MDIIHHYLLPPLPLLLPLCFLLFLLPLVPHWVHCALEGPKHVRRWRLQEVKVRLSLQCKPAWCNRSHCTNWREGFHHLLGRVYCAWGHSNPYLSTALELLGRQTCLCSNLYKIRGKSQHQALLSSNFHCLLSVFNCVKVVNYALFGEIKTTGLYVHTLKSPQQPVYYTITLMKTADFPKIKFPQVCTRDKG